MSEENNQTLNNKSQLGKIIFALALAIISFMYLQVVVPYVLFVAAIPNLFLLQDRLQGEIKDVIITQWQWMSNGFVFMPSSFIGSITRYLCIGGGIVILVGLCSKKDDTKRKTTKIVKILFIVHVVTVFVAAVLQAIVGLLFIVFPTLYNYITFSDVSILSFVLAIMLFVWGIFR